MDEFFNMSDNKKEFNNLDLSSLFDLKNQSKSFISEALDTLKSKGIGLEKLGLKKTFPISKNFQVFGSATFSNTGSPNGNIVFNPKKLPLGNVNFGLKFYF